MKVRELEEFEWIMNYQTVLEKADLNKLIELQVFDMKERNLFELPLEKITVMISEMSRIVKKYIKE